MNRFIIFTLFEFLFFHLVTLHGDERKIATVNGMLDMARAADQIVEGNFVRRPDGKEGSYNTNEEKEPKLVITNDFLAGGVGKSAIFAAMPPANKTYDDYGVKEMFREHSGIVLDSGMFGGPTFPIYAGWPPPGKAGVFFIRRWKGKNTVIAVIMKDQISESDDLKKLSLAIKNENIKARQESLIELVHPKATFYFNREIARWLFRENSHDGKDINRFLEKCDALKAGDQSQIIEIALDTHISKLERDGNRENMLKGYAVIGRLMMRRVAFEQFDPNSFNAFLRGVISRGHTSVEVRSIVTGLEHQLYSQYPASKHQGIRESFEKLKAKYFDWEDAGKAKSK